MSRSGCPPIPLKSGTPSAVTFLLSGATRAEIGRTYDLFRGGLGVESAGGVETQDHMRPGWAYPLGGWALSKGSAHERLSVSDWAYVLFETVMRI